MIIDKRSVVVVVVNKEESNKRPKEMLTKKGYDDDVVGRVPLKAKARFLLVVSS